VTKAIYIPGADRSTRWFLDDYPNQFRFDHLEKTLLHSTETTKRGGCPGYSGGSMAPQVTINPWPGYQRIWQHFPINRAGRALGNPSITPVSENKDFVFQVEIIGYSDPGYGRQYGCYLPELPDDGLDYLAKMLAFVHEEWGHPTTLPSTWPLYKVSSWAAMNAAHMTSSAYDRHRGWLAHLHAPLPSSHGDVALNVRALKAKVDAILNPPAPTPTTKEIDMVLVRVRGTDPVYVSTGIERRWIENGTDLTGLQRALRNEGGKGVITTIEPNEIEGFGPLVGKAPPA
jgi:hypothetical protein